MAEAGEFSACLLVGAGKRIPGEKILSRDFQQVACSVEHPLKVGESVVTLMWRDGRAHPVSSLGFVEVWNKEKDSYQVIGECAYIPNKSEGNPSVSLKFDQDTLRARLRVFSFEKKELQATFVFDITSTLAPPASKPLLPAGLKPDQAGSTTLSEGWGTPEPAGEEKKFPGAESVGLGLVGVAAESKVPEPTPPPTRPSSSSVTVSPVDTLLNRGTDLKPTPRQINSAADAATALDNGTAAKLIERHASTPRRLAGAGHSPAPAPVSVVNGLVLTPSQAVSNSVPRPTMESVLGRLQQQHEQQQSNLGLLSNTSLTSAAGGSLQRQLSTTSQISNLNLGSSFTESPTMMKSTSTPPTMTQGRFLANEGSEKGNSQASTSWQQPLNVPMVSDPFPSAKSHLPTTYSAAPSMLVSPSSYSPPAHQHTPSAGGSHGGDHLSPSWQPSTHLSRQGGASTPIEVVLEQQLWDAQEQLRTQSAHLAHYASTTGRLYSSLHGESLVQYIDQRLSYEGLSAEMRWILLHSKSAELKSEAGKRKRELEAVVGSLAKALKTDTSRTAGGDRV